MPSLDAIVRPYDATKLRPGLCRNVATNPLAAKIPEHASPWVASLEVGVFGLHSGESLFEMEIGQELHLLQSLNIFPLLLVPMNCCSQAILLGVLLDCCCPVKRASMNADSEHFLGCVPYSQLEVREDLLHRQHPSTRLDRLLDRPEDSLVGW